MHIDNLPRDSSSFAALNQQTCRGRLIPFFRNLSSIVVQTPTVQVSNLKTLFLDFLIHISIYYAHSSTVLSLFTTCLNRLREFLCLKFVLAVPSRSIDFQQESDIKSVKYRHRPMYLRIRVDFFTCNNLVYPYGFSQHKFCTLVLEIYTNRCSQKLPSYI